jgi:undecaprenyl pyrophosphate phosphatase UppP
MVLSVVLLGVGGFEMALFTWGLSTPWIAVSLVSVVLIGPIGAFVLDPRMRTILAMVRETPDGPLSDALARRTRDPVLVIAVSTLATVLLGIVFLMTTKPQLVTSMLVMGIAVFVGLIVSLPFWSATRRQANSASAQVNNAEADPFLRKTIWTRRW